MLEMKPIRVHPIIVGNGSLGEVVIQIVCTHGVLSRGPRRHAESFMLGSQSQASNLFYV